MEWISVEDRLPESQDACVLVYFDHDAIDMVHIQDWFDDVTCGLDENGVQLYTKRYLYDGVTHWMPLPEPPTKSPDNPVSERE